MTEHETLFLAGVARSGTTAMRRVLQSHPDVALGMERYKKLWGDEIDRLTPAMFDRDRFFDYSDGHTNVTPELAWARPHLDELDAKWDTARYHGDKMTAIRAQRMWVNLPDARFVFIVRDVAEVASSWQRRATDDADLGWRPGADAVAAVKGSNKGLHRVLVAATRRPRQAVVVEHSRFFGDPEGAALAGVMDFLGLDPAPVAASWQAEHRTYVDSVAGRNRTLPPEAAAFVAEHADHATWERVVALSL